MNLEGEQLCVVIKKRINDLRVDLDVIFGAVYSSRRRIRFLMNRFEVFSSPLYYEMKECERKGKLVKRGRIFGHVSVRVEEE